MTNIDVGGTYTAQPRVQGGNLFREYNYLPKRPIIISVTGKWIKFCSYYGNDAGIFCGYLLFLLRV
jgi:hypothetical protein